MLLAVALMACSTVSLPSVINVMVPSAAVRPDTLLTVVTVLLPPVFSTTMLPPEVNAATEPRFVVSISMPLPAVSCKGPPGVITPFTVDIAPLPSASASALTKSAWPVVKLPSKVTLLVAMTLIFEATAGSRFMLLKVISEAV